MRLLFYAFLFCSLQFSALAETQFVSRKAKVFATPDSSSLPVISPSGRFVAILEWNETSEVVVYDFYDPAEPVELLRTAGNKIDGQNAHHDHYAQLRWLNDDKLFIDIIHDIKVYTCRGQVVCQNKPIFVFKVLDIKNRTLSSPFKKDFPTRINTKAGWTDRSQSNIAHWPHAVGENLLLEFYEGIRGYYGSPSVYIVDQDTLATQRYIKAERSVYGWAADNDGEIRFRFKLLPNYTRQFQYRLKGEKRWRVSSQRISADNQIFRPIGASEKPNVIYVISNHDEDTTGLFRYDLLSDEFKDLVVRDPENDVTSVRLSRNGAIKTVSAGGKYLILDNATRRAIEAFPDFANDSGFTLQSESRDGQRVIYEVASSSNPGVFFLYDKSLDRAFKISERRTRPDWVNYSYKKEIEIEARDGLRLQAYISLPRDITIEAAYKLPFVILPHGGPWSRDYDNYDDMTQFINALGVGVIKVNFRGSAGFGREFQELGYGQWGRAMQDDLNDALNWIVKERLADPDRICMVGWSYGGYASLMAAVRDGGKYACAASIAGVTDLVRLVRREADNETIQRLGASSRYDSRSVAEISPLERVEDIAIPIFLAHGQFDIIVPARYHYAPMLDALLETEKDVDYVAFAGGNHSLSRYEDREILYTRLGLFLEKHLLQLP
ncbi:MAG: prolyl oligopeptidase family serine peptidase [Pseudomonadota bacterium]